MTSIKQQELPIDVIDATEFARFALTLKPPPGFFGRLIGDMQYIDEKTFDRDLNAYVQRAQALLGNNPYAVVFEDVVSSASWMYKQLLARGLRPANSQFAFSENEQRFTTTDNIVTLDKISEIVPVGTNILLPEDMSITGWQLDELVQDLPNDRYKPIVFPMYASQQAQDYLKRYGVTMESPIRGIKPCFTAMNNRDRNFLRKIAYAQDLNEEVIEQLSPKISRPLFWTYYKVPLSVFSVLTERAKFPLIRESRFHQPYNTQRRGF